MQERVYGRVIQIEYRSIIDIRLIRPWLLAKLKIGSGLLLFIRCYLAFLPQLIYDSLTATQYGCERR